MILPVSAGDRTVFVTGRGIAGRVVVDADDSGRAGQDGGPEDFSGMNQRGADGADADDGQRGDLEASVQVEGDEGLLIHVNQVAQRPGDHFGGVELDAGESLDLHRE